VKHNKRLPLLLALSLIFVCATVGSGAQQRDLSKMLWEEIVKLSFQPAISESHLTVPVTLNIDVVSEAKAHEIIVRSRGAGTGSDSSYVEIARTTKQSRGPGGFDRFKITIPTCEHIGTRLEVEAIGATSRYKVYSRSFECTSDAQSPRSEANRRQFIRARSPTLRKRPAANFHLKRRS
jgi:hypothetical protein